MITGQSSIRDDSNDERLRLVLVAGGRPKASATVAARAADDMQLVLGVSRDEILAELRTALLALDRNELDEVTVNHLREAVVAGSRRFAASYVYRDHHEVSAGLVWYDLERSETGPEAVPAIVRNKMRYVTTRSLVAGNKAAEDLLGLFNS